jgi:nucleoside-diphosphate-sugar epimerase
MKVLVTGADGYIGVLLARLLLDRGHDVVGLDAGFYKDGWLYNGVERFPPCVNKDIRQMTEEDLKGFDAVVHLAEISNDSSGQLSPEVTFAINHLGSVNLARRCKTVGVRRFVYSSSCSVYGDGADAVKTEESEPRPRTAYSTCKVLVERDVSAMADDDFSPTFLRNATAYGPSPSMRFDLVLNDLAGQAWTAGRMVMTSDGTPWRPLVHVLDICEAVAHTLEAPRESVHNQILNVGDNQENYRIIDVAHVVSRIFSGCEVMSGGRDRDDRSYRVSFEKIASRLPGFRCRRNATTGAIQLRELFMKINMGRDLFEFRAYTRLRQLEHLINTQQIDGQFFWKQP